MRTIGVLGAVTIFFTGTVWAADFRKGGVEPRSATIACTVAADGQVSVTML